MTVRVLIALDEDARVRECVVLTDNRQADELYQRLRSIWGRRTRRDGKPRYRRDTKEPRRTNTGCD
jgi:hypothetical protein